MLSSILNSRSGESREQKPVPRASQGTCSNASSRNSSRALSRLSRFPFFTILICSRYKTAQICYAYLADVPANFRNPETSEGMTLYAALERSQWFTRGWTLQELLAPQWVVFLADDWTQIGTKATLANEITAITGIAHLFNFQDASIAQKMSWAAHRQTTRLEDQAYCLMGLFDVNMPLIYGEGKKAFIRLQLEILSKSDDESIFAWETPKPSSVHRTGLLADTPHGFKGCGQIKRRQFDFDRPPHFMTNKGLQTQLLLQPDLSQLGKRSSETPTALSGGFDYIAPLNCVLEDEDGSSDVVVIHLVEEDGVLSRYGDPELIAHSWLIESHAKGDLKRRLCHIKQPGHNDSVATVALSGTASYTMSFDMKALSEAGYFISDRLIWSENASLSENGKLLTILESGLTVTEEFAVVISSPKQYILLRCESPSGPAFIIILGYLSGRPWIGALTNNQSPLRDIAGSFDIQHRWPQSQSDPRSLRERGWVQIDSVRYIDMALHKMGVGTSSGEKYLVSSKIREELEGAQVADISALSTPLQDSELSQDGAKAAESTDIAGNIVSRRFSL